MLEAIVGILVLSVLAALVTGTTTMVFAWCRFVLHRLIGFALATLAAGLTTVLFVLSPVELTSADLLQRNGILVLAVATQTAVFATIFAIIAVAIAEYQSYRGWPYYALAGMAIAMAGLAVVSIGQPAVLNYRGLAAHLATGLAGGSVYWLVAGRRRRV